MDHGRAVSAGSNHASAVHHGLAHIGEQARFRFADYLVGNEGKDVLYGGDGNDTVYGNQGNDDLHGGAGNDLLYGQEDSDVLYGDAGSDTLVGGSGSDYVNSIDGVAGNDVIYGDNLDGTGGYGAFEVAGIDRAGFLRDGVHGVESF